MKQCPSCNRSYTDDTLNYCLDDGTILLHGPGRQEAATLQLDPPHDSGEALTRHMHDVKDTSLPPSESGRSGPTPSRLPGGKVWLGILLTALLALAGYLAYEFLPQTDTHIRSIAVMPFVNASGNPDGEYLADGMTETLISKLSQLPNLNVKSSSSVFRYKGKMADTKVIGNELSVQAILNGRFVQRGEELTLYVELVDTATENVLWKTDYQRPLSNLLLLQKEIAKDVSAELQSSLSGADEQKLAKNYTEDPEAFQLYLRGRFHWAKRTPRDLEKAIDYFQQAISMDSEYALAYAGLADAYSLVSNYGGGSPRETKPKAREAAFKAVSLDDRLAEAHTALGLILTEYDYDFVRAESAYKRAIELDPNYATAHQFYGELLTHLGRHDESLAELRRALDADPLSLIGNRMYGEGLIFARRNDEAIKQLEKTRDLDPNFASGHVALSTAYQLNNDWTRSCEELAKFQELVGEPRNSELIKASCPGGKDTFLKALTGANRPKNFPLYIIATFHAALGEKDQAIAELNRSYENREYFMVLLKVDPRLDPLRGDPRFDDLVRKVGFPQ